VKKLFEGKVGHPDEPYDGEDAGIREALFTVAHDDTTASRAFMLDEHEVKEWIIAGRLERVLDSFMAGHGIESRKKRTSSSDITYKLDYGLSLRAFQVPPGDLAGKTEKFVLSMRLEGIDARNVDMARTFFADLQGIPV
jgi:hypothetical protein